MSNQFRLKIAYKEKIITLDVDEEKTLRELGKIINDELMIKKTKMYRFICDYIVLGGDDSRDELIKLKEVLKLDQKIQYITGSPNNTCKMTIVVWDYLATVNHATMEKFNQLIKKVNQVHPIQRYYLNKGQRKLLDNQLNDFYLELQNHNFGGVYHYRLMLNGHCYLVVKLKYYMLDDKYEIYLYLNDDKLKADIYEYLITFYECNRAYFKGYQASYRNLFVLHRDKTLKRDEFVEFYIAINRIMFMFADIENDVLFKDHESCLNYDIRTRTYWVD